MPDEEVIEERRLEIQVKVKRKGKNRKNKDDGSTEKGDGDPSGRANPEEDITNTWNYHYQVSQDKKASNRRSAANREQLKL